MQNGIENNNDIYIDILPLKEVFGGDEKTWEGVKDKVSFHSLLNTATEKAKSDSIWVKYVLPALLKIGLLTEDEKKAYTPKYLELLHSATEKAKSSRDWATNVLPALLKIGLLTEDEKKAYTPKYLELLDTATEEAKSDSDWAEYVLPALLNVGFLTEDEKKAYTPKYLELLDTATEQAKSDSDWAGVLSVLLNVGFLTEDEKKAYTPKYLELLDTVTEEAKSGSSWVKYVLPAVLNRGLLTEDEKKAYTPKYLELLDTATEQAKSDSHWAEYVLPALLNVGFLTEDEKKAYTPKYLELLDTATEQAKSDSIWATNVLPVFLNVGFLTEDEKKAYTPKYLELLDTATEKAKSDSDWATNVLPVLLNVGFLTEDEKKAYTPKYLELLDTATEQAKSDSIWARVLSVLLNVGFLTEDEKKAYTPKYLELLDTATEQAKSDSDWAGVLSVLLNVGFLTEDEKKAYTPKYLELLDTATEEAKSDSHWAEYVLPALLNVGFLTEDEKKAYTPKYLELLDTATEKAKSDSDWATNVLPVLLNVGFLTEDEKKAYTPKYLELLDTATEEAKSDSHWAGVLSAVLDRGLLTEEDKPKYLKLLDTVTEEAKSGSSWAKYVLPVLLNVGFLTEEEKKAYTPKYLELLDTVTEKAKSDSTWANYVLPAVLDRGLLTQEDKPKYLELLDTVTEEAKSNSNWARYVLPAVLDRGLLTQEDKPKYLELLDTVTEEAKSNSDWANYVLPALLKLNFLSFISTSSLSSQQQQIFSALQHYNDSRSLSWLAVMPPQISLSDIALLTSFCSPVEKKYLVAQHFEGVEALLAALHTQNYPEIRKFKAASYSDDEKTKLQELQIYFGEEIRTYFFDKVHTTRPLSERFRAPHDALEHYEKIISFAQELETFTPPLPKETLFKTLLAKIPNSNAGYQEFNTFLRSYQPGRTSQITAELNDSDGLKDPHFLQLAHELLAQHTSDAFSLYTRLDNLQKVTALQHILAKKSALKQLEPLTQSGNPKDKIIAEYYTQAIYHPRTSPTIIKMYTNPKEFLGLDDTTLTGLKPLHTAKKPSRMVENFPFLDMEAPDLVDCLPLGIYDQITYFQPMKQQYLITKQGISTLDSLREQVATFLDSLTNTQKGNIVKGYKTNYPDINISFTTFGQNLNSRNREQFQQFFTVVKQYNHLPFLPYENAKLMTAEIAPKSDPTNRFNGFNCDALAEDHGKKVVAMFNPYCNDFCIYEGEKSDYNDRLKVTSWVTLNRKIPQNFNTLLQQIKSTSTHDIAKLFGEAFINEKDSTEYFLTLDNIEADANFEKKNAMAIRQIYEQFFSEYIKAYPRSPQGIPINTHKLLCGKNYGKLNVFTKEEPNMTLPVYVNSYTDNADATTLVGDIDAGIQAPLEKKTGIQEMSLEDVIPISYLEGKIYSEDMKDHVGNLQHEITASILNNTRLNRKNLSFTRYDEQGKLRGYLLSYPGKGKNGEECIYISDFALQEEYRGKSGITMLYHWIAQVKEHYPHLPIITHARQGTSYRLLTALSQKQGYKIAYDTKHQYANEDFHRVIAVPEAEYDAKKAYNKMIY